MGQVIIPTRYSPEAACSKDETRPALHHPYLSWADGVMRLVATNGRILVSVPVTATKEDEGYICNRTLSLAKQFRPNRNGDTQMDLDVDYVTLPNGWKLPRPKDMNFPNWQQVVPSGPWKYRVCFKASYLKAISKGIGSDDVTLEFNDPSNHEPIMVRSADKSDGAYGVLMPIRTA